MSETTNIEWCDSTFNPWIGCTKVSPACDHCYAERSTPARTLAVEWGPKGERHRTSTSNWHMPLRWNMQAAEFQAKHGRRQRVFCASLADVFDNQVSQDWRDDLFALIERTPNLDWLLLTKRIGNAMEMVPKAWSHGWPVHVWLGATICHQPEADRDIHKLLAVPVRVRFLSVEPMLGPIDLRLQRPAREDDRQDMDGYCAYITTAAGAGIKWVICGGESGPDARPMPVDWARSLRDQCAAAGVPFLFKQWGEWIAPSQHREARDANGFAPIREFRMVDDHGRHHRIGKKAAGRLLDGRTHDGFPA